MAKDRPALEPMLRAFGRLLAETARCRDELPATDTTGLALDKERLMQGLPLLEQMPMLRLEHALEQAAPRIIPALAEAFPALGDSLERLGAALADDGLRSRFGQALRADQGDALDGLARDLGMDPGVLGFALESLARPALERYAQALAPLLAEVPWTVWNRGVCPVCGSLPVMALLRPGEYDSSEFLREGAGQRWLCCSLCSHQWRAGRVTCPSCGRQEQENREYLYTDEFGRERIEACRECGRYLLTMDVRERTDPLDHRIAPLGLVHLDILAQERGFTPLADRPWNRLD